MIGIEHEFRVLDAKGEQVDFGKLCSHLPIDGFRIDVTDPLAWWTTDGFRICPDELEAEVATPPMPIEAGMGEIVEQSARAASVLRKSLRADLDLQGYSTHVSLAVPDEIVTEVAHLFAQSYAPVFMLLLDQADSPGLLIRPRYGRLELGGSFSKGEDLLAAITLAYGAVADCVQAVRSGERSSFPPLVRVAAQWATQRFGWYVDRHAFGPDLFDSGRTARMQRRRFGRVTAQRHLESCWERAAAHLTADPGALSDTTSAVLGTAKLPSERDIDKSVAYADSAATQSEHGSVLRHVAYGGGHLSPAIATWSFVVYRTTDRKFLALPRAAYLRFISAVEAGEIDGFLNALEEFDDPMLTHADAIRLGVYPSVRDRRDLAEPERTASTYEQRQVA